MSPEEVVAFMRHGTRTGKLAVTRKDGRPHIAPVWFDVDVATGEFVFVMGKESLKARCIRRDPRVAICVDTMEMPYDFARIDGVASISGFDEDPAAMLHWATETCRRYVGDERAEEFGHRNATGDEVLVRVRPNNYVGATGITD